MISAAASNPVITSTPSPKVKTSPAAIAPESAVVLAVATILSATPWVTMATTPVAWAPNVTESAPVPAVIPLEFKLDTPPVPTVITSLPP